MVSGIFLQLSSFIGQNLQCVVDPRPVLRRAFPPFRDPFGRLQTAGDLTQGALATIRSAELGTFRGLSVRRGAGKVQSNGEELGIKKWISFDPAIQLAHCSGLNIPAESANTQT